MPFLPATLAAIAGQSWRNHSVLVRENGSTDGTLEELRRWIPERLRGEVIVGGPLNVGASCAFLVERAETEYCARIDADDVAAPDRLRRQVEFLETHPEVVSVGSRVRAIDESGVEIAGHGWNLDYHERDRDIVHDLLVRAAQRHPTMLMRRSAVLAAGNYAPFAPGEDYDLQLRLATVGRLANLPEPLLDYRFHAGSVSQNFPGRADYDYHVRASLFARSGAALFGVDTATLLGLKRRERRFALPPLLSIVRTLERRDAIGFARRLFSPSFLHSARHLLSTRDIVSRGFFGAARRLRGKHR